MTQGIRGLYKIQFGVETTMGTEVDETTYWRGQGTINDASEVLYPEEDVGIIGGVGRNYVAKADGTFDLPEIEATFEQLPYLGCMGIEGVAGSQDGSGSGYIYTFDFPYDAVQSPYFYTVVAGDNQQAEVITACFAEQVVISAAMEEAWKMKATLRGWPGGPSSFKGGLSIPSVEEIVFGNTSLYIDDVGTGYGNTQVTESFLSFELTVDRLFKAVWTGDGANKNFTLVKVNSKYAVTLKLTLEHDSVAVAERANRRAGTARAIRIIATGDDFTTAGSSYSAKTVIMDIPGTYSENEALDEDDGNMVIEFNLKNHYDATLTDRGQILVVNASSTLP